jgi:hypothetical protein
VSADQRLQATIDRIVTGLRGQLEGMLRAQADEVQREAKDQIGQVLDSAKKQNEDVRRSAEAQIIELRRLLDDFRRTAQVEQHRHVTEAIDRTRDERVVRSRRFVDEIRALDESRSLAEVLERLLEFAGREVDRAAILIVKSGRVEEWRFIGFPAREPNTQPFAEAVDEAGLIGSAVRERQAVSGIGRHGRHGSTLPKFAAADVTRAAVAFPVTIAGSVVAVLYADAPDGDGAGDPEWRHTLDALTRHASRVLEVTTLQQAIGVRWPMARASQRASTSAAATVDKSTSAHATADKAGHPAPGGLR